MSSPANSKTTRGGSRLYTWPVTGEKFFSVTTILSAIAKPALVNWAAKEVATFAVENTESWLALANTGQREAAIDLLKRSPYRTKTKAADLGSAVHKAVEAHTLGQPVVVDWPEDVAPFMAQFEGFYRESSPEFLLSEATVYNRSQAYAGTLDMIVRLPDGQVWIIDVKTGKGIYPEVALQLAAYAKAEFIGMPDGSEAPMPKIDRAGALHLRPEGWELVEARIDDAIYNSFLYCREMFRWQEEISKEVLMKGATGAAA